MKSAFPTTLTLLALCLPGAAFAQDPTKYTVNVYGYQKGWMSKHTNDNSCSFTYTDPINFTIMDQSPTTAADNLNWNLNFQNSSAGASAEFKVTSGSCYDQAHKPAETRVNGYRRHTRIKNDAANCNGCDPGPSTSYRSASPMHQDMAVYSESCDNMEWFANDVGIDFVQTANYASAALASHQYSSFVQFFGNNGGTTQCNGQITYGDGYVWSTAHTPSNNCEPGEYFHDGICCPE